MDIDERQEPESASIIEREEVLEQRIVHFVEDEVILALTSSGIYASLPGMCRAMGLKTQSQLQRILNTNRLRVKLRSIKLQTRGGSQFVTCLNAKSVSLWLLGVETSKAKPAFQAKIDRYMDEMEPLAERVFADVMGIQLTPSVATALDPRLAALAEQYDTLIDVALFIREHMDALAAMPGNIASIGSQLDQAVTLLESLIQRQDDTERTVEKIDARTQGLTPAHQRTLQEMISHMVEATKSAMTPLQYSMIYGRIKHRFRVASYKTLADEQFEAVMQFLRDELTQALGAEEPAQGNLF